MDKNSKKKSHQEEHKPTKKHQLEVANSLAYGHGHADLLAKGHIRALDDVS